MNMTETTTDYRPCRNSHPVPINDKGKCGVCWAFLNLPKYTKLYSSPPAEQPPAAKEAAARRVARGEGYWPAPLPPRSTGFQLKSILEELGLPACSRCSDRSYKMDEWGPDLCDKEPHRGEILNWLRAEYQKRSWGEVLRASWKALSSGMAFKLDPLDPAVGLLQEAVRRSRLFTPELRGPFPIRDLAYFVCPVSGTGVWQSNLSQLIKRWNLFTGKKIVGVVTGNTILCKGKGKSVPFPLDPLKDVTDSLPSDAEVLEVPNNPNLREVAGFTKLLAHLKSDDPGRALFFSHAKGVTHPDPTSPVHGWASVMYESLLDYWPLVEKTLETHPLAGSFKRGSTALGVSWHYSGSFYWARSSDLFSRNWDRVDHQWWGAESYPGRHFHVREAGCVFHEELVQDPGRCQLYHPPYWEDSVWPDWRGWKDSHEEYRSVP